LLVSVPKLVLILIACILGLILAAVLYSQWQSYRITKRYPNIGELTDIGGIRINSVHLPRPEAADLPPLLFIHGASGNLRDPMGAFLGPLKGRAEMLFVDRPGHGYSETGDGTYRTPDGQADAIARLLERRGIGRAIVIGHSFGGAITATFALRHPDKVLGLVFLSPSTHPWPGGIDWYYDVANLPYLGRLFCSTLTLPAGLQRIDQGVESVFHPNPVPDNYRDTAAIPLVLRPDNFCNNARDVANLFAHVQKTQPHYREITAPTVIITGDSDEIVYEELHSLGLNRDISGSELVWVRGLGHKPDYVATDLAIAAIEKVAGMNRDLRKLADTVEKRIAPD
jgi:pimeloyl-ACP methyl ester carboxylesterase